METAYEDKIRELWISIIEKLFTEDKDYIDGLWDSNVENVQINGKFRNNIVNLAALGETILTLKMNNAKLKNNDIEIHHHNIETIQEYIQYYWSENISFMKDTKSIEIQIVDNLASIIGNLVNRLLPIASDIDLHRILSKNYVWLRNNFTKITNTINQKNTKFDISMREMAVIKAYTEFPYLIEFNSLKNEFFRRLNIRYNIELKNHLNHKDATKILKR